LSFPGLVFGCTEGNMVFKVGATVEKADFKLPEP